MKIVKKYLINLDASIFPAKSYAITAFFLGTFYYYSATKSRSTHYKAVCFSVFKSSVSIRFTIAKKYFYRKLQKTAFE